MRSSNFNFVTKLYIIHNLDSKIVTEDITIDACGGYISAYPDMIGNDDAGFIKYKYTYNRTNNTVNLIDNTSITSYELSYSGYRN